MNKKNAGNSGNNGSGADRFISQRNYDIHDKYNLKVELNRSDSEEMCSDQD